MQIQNPVLSELLPSELTAPAKGLLKRISSSDLDPHNTSMHCIILLYFEPALSKNAGLSEERDSPIH